MCGKMGRGNGLGDEFDSTGSARCRHLDTIRRKITDRDGIAWRRPPRPAFLESRIMNDEQLFQYFISQGAKEKEARQRADDVRTLVRQEVESQLVDIVRRLDALEGKANAH